MIHARAYGLDAIDVVNIHFKQPDILEAEAREGTLIVTCQIGHCL